MITYKFTARGTTPENLKVTLEGEVTGPEGYPISVFEAAREACEDICPGIVFKGDRPNVMAFPVLKALKRRNKKI
jgi:hypothetical protein